MVVSGSLGVFLRVWLFHGRFWLPQWCLACVVVSRLFFVPSVIAGVCGWFVAVSGCLSGCWRVWLSRGCFWLLGGCWRVVMFRGCFWFSRWLLACVVVSWLFLVPLAVAGVCGCFVVVSGSLGGLLACVVVSRLLLVSFAVAGVCGCFMVVPVSLGGCWRVWLFRAWELTLALFSQSVNASWKKIAFGTEKSTTQRQLFRRGNMWLSPDVSFFKALDFWVLLRCTIVSQRIQLNINVSSLE